MRPVLGPKTVGATSGFMGCCTIAPGDSISEHYHEYSEEFLFCVRGTLMARLDGVFHEVPAGSALFIPKYVRHRMENQGDEEVFAVFHMSPLAPRPELGHVDTE